MGRLRLERRAEADAHFAESAAIWRRVVAELDSGGPVVKELVESLHEWAAVSATPRPLLEEALRALKALEGRGELSGAQKALLAKVEKALAELS